LAGSPELLLFSLFEELAVLSGRADIGGGGGFEGKVGRSEPAHADQPVTIAPMNIILKWFSNLFINNPKDDDFGQRHSERSEESLVMDLSLCSR
jgi:hypothetical protein